MRALSRWIAVFAILAIYGSRPIAAVGDDAFFDVALSEVKITSGQLPKDEGTRGSHPLDLGRGATFARAFLDGGGEAYVKVDTNDVWRLRSGQWPDWSTTHLLVRAAAP